MLGEPLKRAKRLISQTYWAAARWPPQQRPQQASTTAARVAVALIILNELRGLAVVVGIVLAWLENGQ
jgi:hypothetical protein